MKYYLFLISSLFVISLNGQLIKDESYLDLSFVKFKNELTTCVFKRDKEALKKLLADSVLEGHHICGLCSKEDFINYLFGDDAEDMWLELESIIRFGFYREKADEFNTGLKKGSYVFIGPSYINKYDADNELIVLGENVNIREKPSLKAKIIKIVSYEKFKCDCNILTYKETTMQNVDGITWHEIYLDDNKTAYVAYNYTSVRLIKDLTVTQINGKWKIIAFYNDSGC